MKQVLLSDVCEINPRIDSGISDDAECSFVPMEYVDEVSGAIANTSVRRVGDVKKGYTFFKNDDVIFAKITPCMENGKCAIGKNLKNGIAFGSTEYHVVRAKEEIIPEWIYHFLRQEKVRQQATGWFRGTAGQQRVPASFLEELKIPLPPLTEQKRIASLLARADRLRQLRRTAHDLGDALLQSVFLEMFGEPSVNDKGWDVVKLSEAFAIKPQIGTPNPAHNGGKYLVVRVGEIGSKKVDLESSQRITLDGKELERFRLKTGDFLLARAIGSEDHLGKASILQDINEVVVFDSHVMRLRFDPKIMLPVFFWHWLKSDGGRARFMQRAGRTAVQFNVNTEQIADINIPLPPLSLQEEFAGVVARVESLRGRMGESARQVEGLFESLLSEVFQ
jgi:type I restriction enzyme, S subunit